MSQEENDAPLVTSLDDLKTQVAIGLAPAVRGELSDGDEFFAELEREELRQRVLDG